MLDLASLDKNIKSLINSDAASLEAAVASIIDAYKNYAIRGSFLQGTLSNLDVQAASLKSNLISAFKAGSFDVAINALVMGLTTFWISVPVVGVNSGLTLGCPGASANSSMLFALKTSTSRAGAAMILSNFLDSATKTVTANVTLPTVPPTMTMVPIM